MRVFYAITFTEKTKEKLSFYRDSLSNHALKGKFVTKDNIHLTLEFIGEIKQADLAVYEEVLDHLSHDSFPLVCNHVGEFPKKNKSVLWLGLKDSPDLIRLQKNLRKLLEVYDLPFEKRKYHPHITMGRQVILDIQTNDFMIPPLDLEIKSLALMHSHRVKDILTYEPIYEIEFSNNPY
ncbi:RNA 2',3'-cyclic phosphodiesterase [Acidaminobacter sp. JC074]|uniref:RNA 2',3'-cyclic phosphodiesterase n=1 Tax=Acidaminobacter sp. JC074 TaxID=2530199 RepID=UPI001F0F230F|nr:RNA 2',3'-cyclic phosphodiesterase [Acidaminobacter sp. JC074]MCH4886605.1 RNA 2',3'-cyclic phosphodiesterase [Acidaminobacter sp. JC074]